MFKIKKASLIILILLSSLLFSGCASKVGFASTPVKNSEFIKSKSDLENQYSDIKEYDRFFASPTETPTLQELEGLWGKPTTEKRWVGYITNFAIGAGLTASGLIAYPFLALIVALNPIPSEKYTWEKGNYKITAKGRSDLLVGYDKRIFQQGIYIIEKCGSI